MNSPQRRSIARFLFRCDASPAVGTGHLRRCATLARELKNCGAIVFFACRARDIAIEEELQGIADDSIRLDWELTPEDDVRTVIDLCHQREANVAVIDHYQADIRYQEELRRSHVRWLQFDGYIKQPLLADWVLNTSPTARESDFQTRKQRDETRLLLGPAYALLRPEFREARPHVKFRKEVRKILLTFGGGDDRGVTLFCLNALSRVEQTIELIVLTGSTNPHLPEITEWINKGSRSRVRLVVDSREVATHMTEADLALLAGGTTTYEAAGMGLPGLIIQTADNQRAHAAAWERLGALEDLGPFGDLSSSAILRQVVQLINNAALRESMSSAGRALVDCMGAQRVAQILLAEGTARDSGA